MSDPPSKKAEKLEAAAGDKKGDDGKSVNQAKETCQGGKQPPVLAIDSITFAGHRVVDEDTLGNFKAPEWQAGRARNHPVAYNRNTAVQLTPTFRVTTKPSEAVEVVVSGSCTFENKAGNKTLTWTGKVKVTPNDATVVTGGPLTSSETLPDAVGCYDPAVITWTATPQNGAASAAGRSAPTIYALLAAAVEGAKDHWTLLDVSCRAAAGLAGPGAMVRLIFQPFMDHKVVRKRDNTQLKFLGLEAISDEIGKKLRDVPKDMSAREKLSAAAKEVASTKGLLEIGGGQCTAWAAFMVDMCHVHGIKTVSVVRVELSGEFGGCFSRRYQFQLKEGLKAQGDDNPPLAFSDHRLVFEKKEKGPSFFYDPSYGTLATSQESWETQYVVGLYDGNEEKTYTPQTVAKKIVEFKH